MNADGSVALLADGNGALFRAYNASLIAAAPGGGSGSGGGSQPVGAPNTGVAPAAPVAAVLAAFAGLGLLTAVIMTARVVYVTRKRSSIL